MAVFPNWGAISANIINSQNSKDEQSGLIGVVHTTRKPTKKDWIITILIMVIPTILMWIIFILILEFA